LVADSKKMEGYCSTGQSPQWAVVPMEEEEEEKKKRKRRRRRRGRRRRRRKYSKMDRRAKDKQVRSPRENGGG